MLRLLLLPAMLMSILLQQCNVSLGELDQYVVNYKISVHNNGDTDAAIHIFLAGTTRDATVAPGGSVEVVSFKPGPWHVNVVGLTARKTILETRAKDLVAALNKMAKTASHSHSAYDHLDGQLDDVDAALDHEVGQVSGGCSGRVEDPAGEDVSMRVTNQLGSNLGSTAWECSGA